MRPTTTTDTTTTTVADDTTTQFFLDAAFDPTADGDWWLDLGGVDLPTSVAA